MRKTVLMPVLIIGFLMAPFSMYAEVCQWVDDKGTIHFTDDCGNIPSSYWEQLKVEIRKDIQEENTPLEPQRIILGSEEQQARTDIYGIGENWWRERVRPWKENLRELNERYQNAEKEFMDKAGELDKRRYGNRHTIKADIIELDRLNQKVLKYQAEISQTEGVLESISKDADESKADPDWLK